MLIIASQGKGNGPAGLDHNARARNRRKDTAKIRQNTYALFSFHNLKMLPGARQHQSWDWEELCLCCNASGSCAPTIFETGPCHRCCYRMIRGDNLTGPRHSWGHLCIQICYPLFIKSVIFFHFYFIRMLGPFLSSACTEFPSLSKKNNREGKLFNFLTLWSYPVPNIT